MTDRNRDGHITRRELGRLGLGFALAIGSAGSGVRSARAEEEALVNEVADNAALVQALSYVNQSPVEGANCSNCAIYLGGSATKGKCGLFQKGVVLSTGHCASWSKKST
jgi:hypothetical protein